MIFARSFGFSPSIQTFIAGAEWNRFSFPFEKFGTDGHDIWGIGTDGHDIWGIFIGGPIQKGKFVLYIDNIRLE